MAALKLDFWWFHLPQHPIGPGLEEEPMQHVHGDDKEHW